MDASQMQPGKELLGVILSHVDKLATQRSVLRKLFAYCELVANLKLDVFLASLHGDGILQEDPLELIQQYPDRIHRALYAFRIARDRIAVEEIISALELSGNNEVIVKLLDYAKQLPHCPLSMHSRWCSAAATTTATFQSALGEYKQPSSTLASYSTSLAMPPAVTGNEIKIYMATTGGIKIFNSYTSEVRALTSNTVEGIAFDETTKTLYASWRKTLMRFDLDSSSGESFWTSNEYGEFRGLSIAPVTGNLLLVTEDGSLLALGTRVTPRTVVEILKKVGKSFSNPAQSPKTQVLFLTTHTPPGIWRVGADGTGLTNITADTADPRGIAVDEKNSIVYWTDVKERAIKASDLSSGGVRTLVQLPSEVKPWGIAHFYGRIYWSSLHPCGSLQSCDGDGQDIRTHFQGTESIWQIVVMQG